MIVPEYWAEAKERVVMDGKSRTYKRFGWSDVSEDDALENARERVAEAAALARKGEDVRLVDHKVSYNGAEGLPIREEIIERHGETVITRNTYGALCLNTPDVMFADIDIPAISRMATSWAVFLAFIAAGFVLRLLLDAWWPVVVAIVAGIFLGDAVASMISPVIEGRRKSPFDAALAKIEAFTAANTSWLLRVYRTPNGFRVLAMHETFDPDGSEAHDFMKEIGSDPLYMNMCRNQHCFRARVSPKPWRIGVEKLKPRPGVWPIKPERMPARRRWVSEYDREAASFASCRYETTFGDGRPARDCEAVRRIHDRMCQSEADLPIA